MALKENAVSGKIKLIFALMEKLVDGQELYVQDRYLQDELYRTHLKNTSIES